MRILDLFSGIGGFSLGLERAGMETVAFCEYDKKCRDKLMKLFPGIPVYEDVRKLTYERLKEDKILAYTESHNQSGLSSGEKKTCSRLSGSSQHGRTSYDSIPTIDLICGGFPCQPWSVAGKRGGDQDDRDLWPEMFRVITEVRPRWVIGENVSGFANYEMGLKRTISDLESEGYETRTFNIPACAVGAPHERKRIWIVAHSNPQWEPQPQRFEQEQRGRTLDPCENVPHTISERGRGRSTGEQNAVDVGEPPRSQKSGPWDIKPCMGGMVDGLSPGLDGHFDREPDIPRVASGVPHRVDRLKQLGNAVVPQIVEIIGRSIMEIEANL